MGEGGAALAVGGEEPHELAVGFFVPRFDGEQLAGGLDARGRLLGVYGRFYQLIEMGYGRLPQPLSHTHKPRFKFRRVGEIKAS